MTSALVEAFAGQRAADRARPGTRRRPLLALLGVAVAWVVGRWARARTATLTIGGLGCLVAAAWQLHTAAGLAAAGAALLLLEWLTGDG